MAVAVAAIVADVIVCSGRHGASLSAVMVDSGCRGLRAVSRDS